jgi:virulence-associated protein VapD
MFALAFDLETDRLLQLHPKGTRQGYSDIKRTVERFGFKRIQGSTYAADHEDHGQMFLALTALRELDWFGPSLSNIRVFRMEQGTDFTAIMQARR